MTPEDEYIAIPIALMDSDAWNNLTSEARCLYVELEGIKTFQGYDNGKIPLGTKDAARRLNIGPKRATRAFRELQEMGIIRCTHAATFSHSKDGRPSEWMISRDYLLWKPGNRFPVADRRSISKKI